MTNEKIYNLIARVISTINNNVPLRRALGVAEDVTVDTLKEMARSYSFECNCVPLRVDPMEGYFLDRYFMGDK